jgi:ferrous iron transport protein B
MSGNVEHSEILNIGLAGQPNTGKSTLFNRLTGLRQHVGNWPGKTVEQKTGEFSHKGVKFSLVDLPGTYSLSTNSTEELITRSHIVSKNTDLLVVMLDASQLQRSMYLLSELVGINIPVIIACSMIDVAQKQGKKIDLKGIEKKLGVPIVAVNATRSEGIETIKETIKVLTSNGKILTDKSLSEKYSLVSGEAYKNIMSLLPINGIGRYSNAWLTARMMENDFQVRDLVKKHIEPDKWERIVLFLETVTDGALKIANAKYSWIKDILAGKVSGKHSNKLYKLGKVDSLVTNWFFGKIISIFMIMFGFALSFLIVVPVMLALDRIMKVLSSIAVKWLSGVHAPLWINSFVTEAVFPGTHMTCLMVAFIIAVVFVFGLMEDVGFLARIAYVFDTMMQRIGLNGKSILPFISSLGCNITAVVGARVIDSNSQRITTIAASLAVPCLATWGVVGFVTAIFFGKNFIWIIVLLFAATVIHMIFTSWLFRVGDKNFNSKKTLGLIMELPPYHKPDWRSVFSFVWGKIKNVASKAGTAIFCVIIVFWTLSYTNDGDITKSFLYSVGKFFEPVSMLIGFDWRLILAFLVAALSREAALGVIAVLFGMSSLDNSLAGIMISHASFDQAAFSQIFGESISKASALAFIFAFYFNVPCLGTMAAIQSETHSTKLTCIIAVYYITTALVIAGIVYHIGLLLF